MSKTEFGTCIITGANGGIGQALAHTFYTAGYTIVATDSADVPALGLQYHHYVSADLARSVADADYAHNIFEHIRKCCGNSPVQVLINNAATQKIAAVANLQRSDWQESLHVNLLAPFFWTQALLPQLRLAKGNVINISSIHAQQSKPQFVAYATSKAALSGMTRSMAIELGHEVRINAIEPAAIETSMLMAGFQATPEKYAQLKDFHPTKKIGQAHEVAQLALAIASDKFPFMNGACVRIDGGISNCLRDPAD